MESVTKYDEVLLKNEHYANHPEMLPYIGENFDITRLLIIAESHFVPKGIDLQLGNEWYNKQTEEFFKKIDGNSNTRSVIANVSKGKGHILFYNISSALKLVNSNFSLKDIAWYNFYQNLATTGKSLKPNEKDKKIALEVFETILETLNPKLVIFVSTLSFNELKGKRKWNKLLNGHQYKDYNIPIGIVPHPTSQWWNVVSKTHGNRTGKQKFIDIVNSHIK